MARNENREPIKITEIETNPAIEAFLKVFDEEWTAQLKELKAKGILPDKGIIYQLPSDTSDYNS